MEELHKLNLDPTAPTFILAECVLVYMPADSSQALVSQLGSELSTAVFVLYEQVPSSALLQECYWIHCFLPSLVSNTGAMRGSFPMLLTFQ